MLLNKLSQILIPPSHLDNQMITLCLSIQFFSSNQVNTFSQPYTRQLQTSFIDIRSKQLVTVVAFNSTIDYFRLTNSWNFIVWIEVRGFFTQGFFTLFYFKLFLHHQLFHLIKFVFSFPQFSFKLFSYFVKLLDFSFQSFVLLFFLVKFLF